MGAHTGLLESQIHLHNPLYSSAWILWNLVKANPIKDSQRRSSSKDWALLRLLNNSGYASRIFGSWQQNSPNQVENLCLKHQWFLNWDDHNRCERNWHRWLMTLMTSAFLAAVQKLWPLMAIWMYAFLGFTEHSQLKWMCWSRWQQCRIFLWFFQTCDAFSDIGAPNRYSNRHEDIKLYAKKTINWLV